MEHSAGLPGVSASGMRPEEIVGGAPGRYQLRPAVAWLVVALLSAGIATYAWWEEGTPANVLFMLGVTAGLAAILTLLSRRALFAAVLVASLIVMVDAAASAKRAAMNMVVHAYDLVFYLGSSSTIHYLLSEQRRYVLGAAAYLLAAALAGGLAYRLDGTRIARRWSVLAFSICVVLAWYGVLTKGERRHMQFYFSNLYVSSFYASWGETIEALWRGTLLEADPQPAASPAMTVPALCEPVAGPPPHIILIHQESVVQPSLFPTLDYDRSVDPYFRSDDGTVHRLRVETYGGASWLTEFSLLAGVSTHSFGSMRQFVQTFMRDRLKDTLPQALARCGYRNVVFYPMLRNFVSNDRFYKSIGLREIFDLKAQGAKSVRERDRFYFDNAMAEMQRHFKATGRPLFTFIQTMSAHWPYDYAFEPHVDVPGGGAGTDPEMHEYLRRVSMAKMDFDYLLAELRRRFPRERFLIVHYGDHHPMATRTLLGYDKETEAEDVALDPGSIGFVTYYAALGINYRVPALPQFEALDVSYLGSLMLDLAGLPLSDSHRERMRLMATCRGRYDACASRKAVLRFHRRLIDAGIVAAE